MPCTHNDTVSKTGLFIKSLLVSFLSLWWWVYMRCQTVIFQEQEIIFPPRSVLIKIVNLCQGCQAYQVCSFILVTSCNMDLRCDEPYRETQKKKKMYSLKEDPCAFGGSVIFVSVQISSDIHYQKCSSQWNHTAEAPISLKSLYMGTLTVW